MSESSYVYAIGRDNDPRALRPFVLTDYPTWISRTNEWVTDTSRQAEADGYDLVVGIGPLVRDALTKWNHLAQENLTLKDLQDEWTRYRYKAMVALMNQNQPTKKDRYAG